MSSVLFYDPLCRQPYDTRTLHTCALGGTEATLTRVADALEAFVIQHNRAEDWGRYRRPQRISGITHVIVNRDSRALPLVAKRSEEHTSELQSLAYLVCRLLLEKKKRKAIDTTNSV